jgi:penicillin-binding protein-related factor A (putative recombinase)
MVQVNGKDAFYLTAKNKQFMESDYSLENLQHQELAYLKQVKYGSDINYYMVFTNSGNQCTLTGFGSFGNIKNLAKKIAAANLVQNNAISETEERKFIILNNGSFIKDQQPYNPPAEKVIVVNNEKQHSSQPADITMKENKIYNNSEMVGIYKRATEGGITTISVYNSNDALVCKASHPDNNDNADWSLVLDGKTVTLLYNPQTPLEKLFKYLAEKGYL